MYAVQFIPAVWLERSAWSCHCGERLMCYSRPLEVERRRNERSELSTFLLKLLDNQVEEQNAPAQN